MAFDSNLTDPAAFHRLKAADAPESTFPAITSGFSFENFNQPAET